VSRCSLPERNVQVESATIEPSRLVDAREEPVFRGRAGHGAVNATCDLVAASAPAVLEGSPGRSLRQPVEKTILLCLGGRLVGVVAHFILLEGCSVAHWAGGRICHILTHSRTL